MEATRKERGKRRVRGWVCLDDGKRARGGIASRMSILNCLAVVEDLHNGGPGMVSVCFAYATRGMRIGRAVKGGMDTP